MGELMLYVKWICLLPLSFVMAVVGRLLAPILPFFAKSDGYLPSWLSWFQTPDNPLDGDKGHWERWPGTSAWPPTDDGLRGFSGTSATASISRCSGRRLSRETGSTWTGRKACPISLTESPATGLSASIAAKSWPAGTSMSSGSGAYCRRSACAFQWDGSSSALTA